MSAVIVETPRTTRPKLALPVKGRSWTHSLAEVTVLGGVENVHPHSCKTLRSLMITLHQNGIDDDTRPCICHV